jgi:hypothetical protein
VAIIDELVVEIVADVDGLKRDLARATRNTGAAEKTIGKSTKRIAGHFRGAVNSVNLLNSAIAGVSVGFLAKQFLDASVTSERLRVQLKTLLGSVGEANLLFDELSTVAAALPFELEEISGAATRLSTAFGKDRDVIIEMTKAASNVAAIFGEKVGGITGAADQISRAFTAGTGAADLFRDAGVTAMLDIEKGASLSGEEFRKKFLSVFGAVDGEFKDAAFEMANTWEGLTSMMADKWFQWRNTVMDEGVFDYLKAVAMVVDKDLGEALKEGDATAKVWATNIIAGAQSAAGAVGILADGVYGIIIIAKTVELAFEALKFGITAAALDVAQGIEDMINGVVDGINKAFENKPLTAKMFGLDELQRVDIGAGGLRDQIDTMGASMDALGTELHDLLMGELPSSTIEKKLEEIQLKFMELQAAAVAAKNEIIEPTTVGGMGQAGDVTAKETGQAEVAARLATLQEGYMLEQEQLVVAMQEKQFTIEEGFQLELLSAQERTAALLQVEDEYNRATVSMQQKTQQARLSLAAGFLSGFAALAQAGGKKTFGIFKALQIAETLVSTYASAQLAYQSQFLPVPDVSSPTRGAIAAAGAVAGGLARLAAIKSATPGGGGGGSGGGGGGGGGGAVASVGSAGIPTAQFSEPEQRVPNIVVNNYGTVVGDRGLDEMVADSFIRATEYEHVQLEVVGTGERVRVS